MKKILTFITIITTTLFLVSCNFNYDLIIYLPNDYIDESIIKSFNKEYGVKVGIINFNSNEVALKQIKENPNSYDILLPSEYAIEELAKEGFIEKIDWTKLDDFKKTDLSIDLSQYLNELKDDGFDVLDYSVPYFWGSLGLLYNHNIAGLKERVMTEEWNVLSDQTLKTMLYDSSRDSFMIALANMDKELNSATAEDIEKAKLWLINSKGPTTSIKSDEILDEAVGGKTPYDVAVVYSGDATYILQETASYSFYNPSRTNVWVDGFAINKNSEKKELAYQFINWFSKQENNLENTLEIGYTSVRQDVINIVLADDDFKETRISDTYLVKGITNYEFFRYNKELFRLIDTAWIDVKSN